MKKTNSLRFKLTLILVFAIVLPLIISNGICLIGNYSFMEASVYSQNEKLVQSLSRQLETLTSDLDDAMLSLSHLESVQNMNPNNMKNALSMAVEHHDLISQIYVMDTSGMQIFKTSGTLGDRSDRDYFKTALGGTLNYSDVIISGSTGKPIVVLALPVEKNSKIVGVIGASIDLSELSTLSSATQTGRTGYGFIVESSGKLIAHPNGEYITEMKDVSDLAPVANAIQKRSGVTEYVYDGESKLAAYTYLEETRWGIVVQTPSKEAFETIHNQIQYMTILLLAFVIISFILAWYLSKYIVNPLLALHGQVTKIANGDLRGKIPEKLLKRTDEYGQLAQGFETMQDNVTDIISNIQHISEQSSSASSTILSLAEQMGMTSEDIAQTVQSVAEGATNQAEETIQTTNIAGSLAQRIESINTKLENTVSLSNDMGEKNSHGQNAIHTFFEQYEKTKELTLESVHVVYELSEKSAFINTIIDTIQNITEQTSLLALNASIEAARAGEHGRGFSVVADEVRKLAGQSHEATVEISERMAEISRLITQAAESMKASQSINEETSETLQKTKLTLDEVGTSSVSVGEHVNDVYVEMEHVADSKDKMIASVENVSLVAQDSAAATEEMSASIEEMAASIQEIVSSINSLNDLISSLSVSTKSFKL